MIECENLSTQPNEGGRGGQIVEFLDRHDVQCPKNKVPAYFLKFCEATNVNRFLDVSVKRNALCHSHT